MSLSIVTPLHADSEFRVRNFNVASAELAPLVAKHGLELIVVEAGGDHAANRSHVTRVPFDRPFAKAAANNVGWTAASGDVICFADADMVMSPEHWETAIKEAERHPFYSPYRHGAYLGPDATRFRVRENFTFDWSNKVNKPTAPLHFAGGIVCLHRWLLEKIYGWDERFVRWGGEDNALMKLATRHARPQWGRGVAYHLHHEGGHRKKAAAKRFLRMHYPKGKWESEILAEKLEVLRANGSPVAEVIVAASSTPKAMAPSAGLAAVAATVADLPAQITASPAVAVSPALATEPAYEGETLPIPAVHSGSPADNWFVAVTTAPRQECTLQQCIDSLRSAGWDPTIFAEPGSTVVDAETVQNEKRSGPWHNWLQSARYAIENTDASLILTVQDDVILHPESRSFIESVSLPSDDTGFLSLYTPKHYSFVGKTGQLRPTGITRIATQSLWGACSIAWPRGILAAVIDHPIANTWLGAPRKGKRRVTYRRHRNNPGLIANVDTAIGKILNALGRKMFFVDPSLAQHVAKYSTLGNGPNDRPDGRRNCYRFADHSRPIREQVFPSKESRPRVNVPRRQGKIGLIGFNTAQGLGHMNRDIAKHLPLERWLVTEHRRRPMLPPIEGVNSNSVPAQLSDASLRERLEGLDIVVFAETASDNLPRVARSMGIKTVCIPMVEWLPMDREWTQHIDLWLAATQFSFNQLLTLGVKGNVVYCPWPIDAQAFEFQQRTKCERFVFAHGNGGPRDRKGGRAMAEAARMAPDIPLIVYSQVQHGFRSTLTDDVEWPDTVDFRGAVDSPAALYQEGDVFVLPSRWEGLGLQLFESQASGMPLITTDGPPMNEANPWKRLPCTPRKVHLSHDYVSFDVSPETIVETMRASLGADIAEASRAAREWVIEHRDWSKRAPAILKAILEG